jgi:hypothetical protein
MAKKQEGPRSEAEVAFDFSAGETRTVEIKAPGHKPFSATFSVPGVGGRADLALAVASSDMASRGEEMVRFVARYLQSWTLPRPETWPKGATWPNLQAVESIQSPTVLFALFSAIRDAEAARKN